MVSWCPGAKRPYPQHRYKTRTTARPTTSRFTCAAWWRCGTRAAATQADTSSKHTLTTQARCRLVSAVADGLDGFRESRTYGGSGRRRVSKSQRLVYRSSQSRQYMARRQAPLARAVTYLIALAVGALALAFLAPSSAPFILISGIMIGITIPMLDAVAANSRYLRLVWYSVRYRRQQVRLSVSYLFRIKVDETYLLIHSQRWPTFGPVGGVYKVSASAKGYLNDIGALSDNLVPIDETSRDDLRIRIPGSKLVSFVRWFESGRSRETSPWREFYEEMIESKILPLDCFPFIFHDFIRRDIRPIRYSKYAQSVELLIADIHELVPTPEQLTALQNLKRDGNPNIIWVTEDQIRRLGAVPGKVQEFSIAETAVWTL